MATSPKAISTDESISPPGGVTRPQNKRPRKVGNEVVENTLMKDPSTADHYQQFTIDEIFPSTADRGNLLPFSDLDVIDWDNVEVIDLDNLLNYNVNYICNIHI